MPGKFNIDIRAVGYDLAKPESIVGDGWRHTPRGHEAR